MKHFWTSAICHNQFDRRAGSADEFERNRLPCSIGCATSKLVAKIANDFGKKQVKTGRAPQTITVIEPGYEARFLAPLDIQALWGVGPSKLNFSVLKG